MPAGSDRIGHIAASWHTEPPSSFLVALAQRFSCGDCAYTTTITERPHMPTFYDMRIEHAEGCPRCE